MVKPAGPRPATFYTISLHALIYARVPSKDRERESFSTPRNSTCFGDTHSKHDLRVLTEVVDVETARQDPNGLTESDLLV